MTRVLVLGAGGFLGRHVVEALDAAGAVVLLGPARAELDLAAASEDDVVALLRSARPEAVVNATGRVAGTPEELHLGNVRPVQALVTACAGVDPGIRLVSLGSIAEYGVGDGSPLAESAAARPISAYGRAKLHAAEVLVGASTKGEVDGVVLRVANPVGAGQPPSSLLGCVIEQVRTGLDGRVELGPLDGHRDFVSARDVGSAVAAAALTPVAVPRTRVTNIGTGVLLPVRDVVQTMLELSGFTGQLVEGAREGSARSGSVTAVVPDVSQAAEWLGWHARDGVRQALEQLMAGAGLALRSR